MALKLRFGKRRKAFESEEERFGKPVQSVRECARDGDDQTPDQALDELLDTAW